MSQTPIKKESEILLNSIQYFNYLLDPLQKSNYFVIITYAVS
jgi:hypothetical protein